MYAVVGNWVLHVCKDVCVNVCGCMWVCGSVGLSVMLERRQELSENHI